MRKTRFIRQMPGLHPGATRGRQRLTCGWRCQQAAEPLPSPTNLQPFLLNGGRKTGCHTLSAAGRWLLSRVAATVARSYLVWGWQGVGGHGLPAGDRRGAGHGEGGGVPTSRSGADSGCCAALRRLQRGSVVHSAVTGTRHSWETPAGSLSPCPTALHPGKCCCADRVPPECPLQPRGAQVPHGLILQPRAEAAVGGRRLDPLAGSLCPSFLSCTDENPSEGGGEPPPRLRAAKPLPGTRGCPGNSASPAKAGFARVWGALARAPC